MAQAFAKPSEDDISMAEHGLLLQIECFGLNKDELKPFVDHLSVVMATDKATIRKMQSIIDSLSVKVHGKGE